MATWWGSVLIYIIDFSGKDLHNSGKSPNFASDGSVSIGKESIVISKSIRRC